MFDKGKRFTVVLDYISKRVKEAKKVAKISVLTTKVLGSNLGTETFSESGGAGACGDL